MPRLRNTRASSFEISSSSTGTMRGKNSRIVTSVPKLRKIDANSTPTAPAPITISDFGGALKLRISILVRIVSSAFNPGSSLASDPVASITFFAFTGLFCAVRFHFHCVHAVLRAARQSSKTRNNGDLVLLHQELEALHVFRDNRVLARQHRRPIERPRLNALDAKLLGFLQVVPQLGVEQQRLGRNAAHMQARPAQLRACVDQRHLQPVLRPANRRRISRRPAANHCHVINRFRIRLCHR